MHFETATEYPVSVSSIKAINKHLLLAFKLTQGLLAVKDMEVVVHAGCQQQVLIGRMPLQPPDSTTHGALTDRLPHVPSIPQQNLLIIAARREARITRQDNHITDITM